MKTNIKVTNMVAHESVTIYLEKKLLSLEKLLRETDSDLVMVDVELALKNKHHKTGDIYRAEINCKIGKDVFRAESDAEDIIAAIDLAKDEIVKEVKAFKGKKRSKKISGARKIKKEEKGV